MTNRIYYSDEAERYARRKMTVMTIIFTALGMAIGAVIALLFAPKEGSDIRDQISSEVEAGLRNGRDASDSAIKRLEGEYKSLREQIEDLVSKARN